ncbi:MAG: ketopantoate reductase family protein [Thalassobaculum sp.]
MRVCIYGAGAIGGYLGVALAEAGCEVSLVARGPHLAAIRENGLTLLMDGATSDGDAGGIRGPGRPRARRTM